MYTKEQLLQIAEFYKIEITSKDRNLKETLRSILKSNLVKLGVLERPLVEEMAGPSVGDHALRLRELALREKELEFEKAKLELRNRELDHEFALKRMELEMANKKGAAVSEFDLGRNRRMVPPFLRKGC